MPLTIEIGAASVPGVGPLEGISASEQARSANVAKEDSVQNAPSAHRPNHAKQLQIGSCVSAQVDPWVYAATGEHGLSIPHIPRASVAYPTAHPQNQFSASSVLSVRTLQMGDSMVSELMRGPESSLN